MNIPKIPVILCALIALTAFAGCLGGADTVDPVETKSDEPPAKADEVKVSDATGSIRGEALNVDLDPVAGADVVLVETVGTDAEKGATVAKDGSFVINDVAPGTYTVYVQAVLHNPARKSVDVKAGEVAQVSLMLETIPDPDRKFVDEREYAGLVGYAVAWHAEGPAGCIIGPDTPVTTPKTCGGLRSGDGGEFASINGEVAIESHERAHTIFAALQWNPAGPLGENLKFDFMCSDVPRGQNGGAVLDTEHVCYFDDDTKTSSPIIHRLDKEHWEENGYNYTGEWAARVFGAPGMIGTYESAKVDAGVAYQQSFMIYTEVWVNHAAPEDHSPLPDA